MIAEWNLHIQRHYTLQLQGTYNGRGLLALFRLAIVGHKCNPNLIFQDAGLHGPLVCYSRDFLVFLLALIVRNGTSISQSSISRCCENAMRAGYCLHTLFVELPGAPV